MPGGISAKRAKGDEADALLLRAGYWYEQVMETNESGLIKLKVEKRLEELVEVRQRAEQLPSKRAFPAPSDANPLWNCN